MPDMKARIAVIILAASILGAQSASAGMKYFTAIEFRGLRNLSRNEIIHGVGLAARGKGIVVDMDSLEKSLGSFAIIQGYTIDEKNGRLILSVTERNPRFIIAHRGKGQTVVFEVDAQFRPIAFNRIYCPWLPVIHIGDDGMKGNQVSEETRTFCMMLERERKSYPALFREIRDIFIGRDVDVLLTGRRTRFILPLSGPDFRRLNFIAGYLDSRGQYPEKIMINDDKVLIRQGV
jgi:hypothetical protein